MRPLLPSQWETERLSIRDSVLDKLPEQEAITVWLSLRQT